MEKAASGIVAVVGATGLQGAAVTRRLLDRGWQVRALTRDPTRKKARSVAALGADIVQGDADDPRSLERAFAGARGVYCVQNHHVSGYAGEVRQGQNITDVALHTGVQHVVYAAGGIGEKGTGVGSWETKVQVAEYMRDRRLPVTVLRPMAFMELMTARRFFPAASTWHVMPKLMGATRPVGWLAVDDLAAITAKVLADRDRFVGADLALAADVQSIQQCRELWRQVMGRAPRRLPLPVGLFERFVGTDETTMWRWLRAHEIDLDPRPTLQIHPDALSVRAWLVRQRAALADPAGTARPAAGAA